MWLDAIFCNNKQRWNKNKCRCESKELIDKGICDKRFIWNPSNCECEFDKNCNIGEYLDYENCKCRKKLVDELIHECTETIEEVKVANITTIELHSFENENKYGSCRVVYCIDDSSFCNFYWNYCLFSLLQLVLD